ncbi:MAG: hypothetical protein RLZZ546_2004 [Bacteroidota bacterium]|jgi:hypothetical protein
MLNITKILKDILEKFNIESYKFTQKNKIGVITLYVNESWNANQKVNSELIDVVKALDIINVFHSKSFTMGKKIENKSRYCFIFSLKKEYYDGSIDMNHYNGQMLSLVAEKDIKSKEDFYKTCLDLIKNMSDYTHTLKFKEKRKYREIKLTYIENLYNLGFIESMAEQISYCKDSLILFKTKFGHSFHLRKDDCYFISDSVMKSLELLPMLYLKREIDADSIDMDFLNYTSLLKHSGNDFIFQNAEIHN